MRRMQTPNGADVLTAGLLRLLAAQFNWRPGLRRQLHTVDGWLDFSVGFRTESDSVSRTISFSAGRARVRSGVKSDVTTTLIFRDEAALRQMLSSPPNETLMLMLKNRMRTEGNLSYLTLFNYLLSLVLQKLYIRQMRAAQLTSTPSTSEAGSDAGSSVRPKSERLRGEPSDAVVFLDEPYLGRYGIDDFPRLKGFLDLHFTTRPEICPERPVLLTSWFRQYGFEAKPNGEPWNPVLRQGHAFKHLMEQKQPRIGANDLLAGTTTSKDVGVVLYPDTSGVLIWGELLTAGERLLNPYELSDDTVRVLHNDVFPYWVDRNMREWVRDHYDAPLCQAIDERFAAYFSWKTVALSHTVPDFPAILKLGAAGIIEQIDAELDAETIEPEKADTLQAMRLVLEGMIAYGRNLATEARLQAQIPPNPSRRAELDAMAAACERVPEQPARTLQEAVQSIWTTWIALHMENTNAGLSLGRLDQWLQPYFAADMEALHDAQEREEYVRLAVELVSCFFLRCTDHMPLVPDIGNYLFGGASSDQAITVGGVTPDGESAVCDMTYVLLKATEMLALRDPNINARYAPENSDTYLRRVCEVNVITRATPSMHGDQAMLSALESAGYPLEDCRDWSATGCVEPTISGKHLGHTNCMMFSLVAPLEMALRNGRHPLMKWELGPPTGDPATGCFADFEEFYAAYVEQLSFMVNEAVTYNNMLGQAHSILRPTPLLSSLIQGPLESGRDVTMGGARYNTSGAGCIGLADVVDSLLAIEYLVFAERQVSFGELLAALDADFVGYESLHALASNKAPRFGSGDLNAIEMARRVQADVHRQFNERRNFRGGPYTSGFWSMSNHVAFGNLSGALPSGRLAGKAFSPGLTPSPLASPNLMDNLHDVAALDPTHNRNNMAFNVKYVPAPVEGHEQAVDHIADYVKTYFDLGGMQCQLNVVGSDTLRDAMIHPERYRDLLVRISGYNAYFVTLNHDMQIELVERAEY